MRVVLDEDPMELLNGQGKTIGSFEISSPLSVENHFHVVAKIDQGSRWVQAGESRRLAIRLCR
jgi:hypothetical protein